LLGRWCLTAEQDGADTGNVDAQFIAVDTLTIGQAWEARRGFPYGMKSSRRGGGQVVVRLEVIFVLDP